MWFSKQKEKDEPLKTLKEREIQEKLYGRFRRPYPDTISSDRVAPAEIKPAASAMPQSVKSSTLVESSKPREYSYPKNVPESVNQPRHVSLQAAYHDDPLPRSRRSFRILNFSVISKILGLVILSIAVFFLAWWLAIQFHHEKPQAIRSGSELAFDRGVSAPAAVTDSKAMQESRKKTSDIARDDKEKQVRSTVTAAPSIKSQAGQDENSAQAIPPEIFFSIQVCTYNSEDDANRLIGELKSQNMPAFHQTSPIRGSDSKLHLVMLGKDATYPDAQKRLEQFRKTEVSKKFSDAYIRRVS